MIRAWTDGTRTLLWSSVADAARAARIHAPDCGMVQTARKNGRAVADVTVADLDGMVADLNDRGFTVKFCKCTRAPAAFTLDGEPLEGTLDAFFAANDFDPEDAAAMRALRPGDAFTGGGGGWGTFTLRRLR